MAEAVSLDRKLYGITKREGAYAGERSLARAKPGKLTSLRRKPALPQRAASGHAKCLFLLGIVGHFGSQTVWQYYKREGACVGEPQVPTTHRAKRKSRPQAGHLALPNAVAPKEKAPYL